MKTLALCLLCLLAPTFPMLQNLHAQDRGPEFIVFPSAKGEVHFRHRDHQQRNPDCISCHHQGAGTRCRDCHGQQAIVKGKSAPAFETAAHKRCAGCHDTYARLGKPAGPQGLNCKGCHAIGTD